MSISEPTQQASTWLQAPLRRWLLLLIVLGITAVMGFYTVTENSHLHGSLLLDGSDWASYALCHRISERSFTIAGRQFPLCARCSGMYLGAALVLIVMIIAGRMRRAHLPRLKLLLVLLGLMALMGIDGLNSYSHFFANAPHLYEPRNWLRLTTGMGTGVAMGLIILPALAQSVWRKPENRAIIDSGRELLALLLLALVAIVLILSNQSTLLYVLALTSVAGLLFIVATLNTVILLVMFRQDGRATTFWQALIPFIVGFLVALVELSLISYLRFSITGTMTGFPGI